MKISDYDFRLEEMLIESYEDATIEESAMAPIEVAQLATQSYADAANSRFHKSKSQYVTLPELIDMYAKSAFTLKDLHYSKDAFASKFKHAYKNWKDIQLCRAFPFPLSDLVIDITLQRALDINHLCNIVTNFNPYAVRPINVYEDTSMPGKYICYDGMHTATTLFIIAEVLGFSNNLSQCIAPGAVSQSHEKSVIRHNFVYMNSEGVKKLDGVDLFQQMVFGVRTDGSVFLNWSLAEKKQQLLEKAGIFVTNKKFGDTKKPGAFAALTQFLDDTYDLSITEQFCKYFVEICDSNRPVGTKESWLMYDFFYNCQKSNIKVTDTYIKKVADAMNAACGGTYHPIKFYLYSKTAHENWYKKYFSADKTLRGITRNENRIGAEYLNAVLAKYSNVKTPTLHNGWFVDPSDIL